MSNILALSVVVLVTQADAAAAVSIRESSLSTPLSANDNRQKLTNKNDRYQTEESSYNQLGIYNNNQEQPKEQQIT
jgi:hypothetical protein